MGKGSVNFLQLMSLLARLSEQVAGPSPAAEPQKATSRFLQETTENMLQQEIMKYEQEKMKKKAKKDWWKTFPLGLVTLPLDLAGSALKSIPQSITQTIGGGLSQVGESLTGTPYSQAPSAMQPKQSIPQIVSQAIGSGVSQGVASLTGTPYSQAPSAMQSKQSMQPSQQQPLVNPMQGWSPYSNEVVQRQMSFWGAPPPGRAGQPQKVDPYAGYDWSVIR